MGALFALATIHTWSLEALGIPLAMVGTTAAQDSGSAVYPTANLALYVPFVLQRPFLIKKLFAYNGTAVSGNIDVGVYDAKGTKIISAGSTAQAGTSTIQEFDVTDTLLGRGQFYMAIALDNTTGTIFRATAGTVAAHLTASGMFQQATAFPLPATATFASIVTACVPMFGLSRKTLLL